MGKWFLDFSFWTRGYRTAQTAHCALDCCCRNVWGWMPSIGWHHLPLIAFFSSFYATEWTRLMIIIAITISIESFCHGRKIWFLENYVSKVSRVLRKAFQWGVLAQRGLPPANTCKWIGGLEEGALGGQCGEWASCQNSGFTSRRDWGELLVLWQATFKCKELSFQLHVWNVKVF